MKNNKIHIHIKVCPECNSHIFNYDTYKKEVYCKLCGLIINAPPSADFTTPDLKTITITINIHEIIIE